MVWLHGFLGCAEDLQPLIEGLAGQRRGIALDLPGHGPQPSATLSFEQTADVLLEQLSRAGIPQFDLAGYSMGGRLACAMLARAPERILSLTLIGANPGLDLKERDARRATDAALAQRLRQTPFADFLDDWYRQALFGGLRDQPGYPSMIARRLRGQPAALAAALECLSPAAQPDYWPTLIDSSRPLCFVAGSRDEKYQAIGARLASQRTIQQVSIPQAAHAAHAEQPRAVIDALTAWLSRR